VDGIGSGGDEQPPFAMGQVMTVFRSRRRAESEDEYLALSAELAAAAQAVPGFVDHKTFAAPDGERVTLVTFADDASQRAWREDPRHRAGQQRGRDQFYEEYSIQVGTCTHVSQWERTGD
jgi:heme-degrading monooxygenase HmoA